ncbi:MAG: ribonuclease HII [Chloroflexota bacterium]|nr:ribonuclease HII [Chloroflexota bacterium]
MNGHVVGAEQALLAHERTLWRAGFELIAGVDEVGRGALAGPLVAAAVVLPASTAPSLDSVRDSKLLSPNQRDDAFARIADAALAIGIGVVPPATVDTLGIVAANRRAMEDAILQLSVTPDAVLLDAIVTDLGHLQIGLIDGDARSLSIAAASIIAKVTRDRFMIEQDMEHPHYGFAAHKGYGVARHLSALAQHGPCALHRRSFAPVRTAATRVDAGT